MAFESVRSHHRLWCSSIHLFLARPLSSLRLEWNPDPVDRRRRAVLQVGGPPGVPRPHLPGSTGSGIVSRARVGVHRSSARQPDRCHRPRRPRSDPLGFARSDPDGSRSTPSGIHQASTDLPGTVLTRSGLDQPVHDRRRSPGSNHDPARCQHHHDASSHRWPALRYHHVRWISGQHPERRSTPRTVPRGTTQWLLRRKRRSGKSHQSPDLCSDRWPGDQVLRSGIGCPKFLLPKRNQILGHRQTRCPSPFHRNPHQRNPARVEPSHAPRNDRRRSSKLRGQTPLGLMRRGLKCRHRAPPMTRLNRLAHRLHARRSHPVRWM